MAFFFIFLSVYTDRFMIDKLCIPVFPVNIKLISEKSVQIFQINYLTNPHRCLLYSQSHPTRVTVVVGRLWDTLS